MKDSHKIRFLLEDDQKDNFWAKLRGTHTESKYIGSAEFDFRSDFEMADGDPSKYDLKDSAGNLNGKDWHKIFDEEIDLFY